MDTSIFSSMKSSFFASFLFYRKTWETNPAVRSAMPNHSVGCAPGGKCYLKMLVEGADDICKTGGQAETRNHHVGKSIRVNRRSGDPAKYICAQVNRIHPGRRQDRLSRAICKGGCHRAGSGVPAWDATRIEDRTSDTLVCKSGAGLAKLQQQDAKSSRFSVIGVCDPAITLNEFLDAMTALPTTNSVMPVWLGCPLPSSGTQRW